MKKMEQKWEQILKVMETSMKPAKYQLWISELELMKVDEELQAIFVSARDPFKAAFAMSKFGENLDRAAELVFGSGYKIYVTYDRTRQEEDDYLTVRDSEYTVVDCEDGYKHRVRMLLLTNTDIDDDELDNVIRRIQDAMRRTRELDKQRTSDES